LRARLKESRIEKQSKRYVDLERGIFYRKAIGKRTTRKRQTPAPIPPRRLAHLRRWPDRKLIATCAGREHGAAIPPSRKAPVRPQTPGFRP
jgi:hypothetical protein